MTLKKLLSKYKFGIHHIPLYTLSFGYGKIIHFDSDNVLSLVHYKHYDYQPIKIISKYDIRLFITNQNFIIDNNIINFICDNFNLIIKYNNDMIPIFVYENLLRQLNKKCFYIFNKPICYFNTSIYS